MLTWYNILVLHIPWVDGMLWFVAYKLLIEMPMKHYKQFHFRFLINIS